MIEIRPLREQDYAGVVQVWIIAGLPFKPQGRDAPELYAEQLHFPGSHFLGAFDGDRLVGVVFANHEGRRGWLNRLAVLPDYQRQGVAAALVEAATHWFTTQKIKLIGALVEADNAASLAFMASIGYKLHDDIHYLSRRNSEKT